MRKTGYVILEEIVAQKATRRIGEHRTEIEIAALRRGKALRTFEHIARLVNPRRAHSRTT
jgi:hypothetical protein